jgi:hypothetical protein
MVAGEAVTVTVATGAGVIDSVALPDLVSLVAVTVTDRVSAPRYAFGVTKPLADTVATRVSELVHVTERPVSVAPVASFTVAVSCCVAPTVMVAGEAVTVTVAAGTGSTLTATLPVTASALAEIVTTSAAPPSTRPAVTSPVADTVATASFDDAQVTVRPESAFPSCRSVATDNCTVPPLATVALGVVT